MNPDLVNASFELFAGLFILNHIRATIKAGGVEGISLTSVTYFVVWGFWNLFYYPHLGQTVSYYAGVFVAITNLTWLGVMLYYRYFKSK